ncbi:MAG: ADP-ribosylglycohydrolase family protein [Selenomonadaceae bacterium]|nr:ADP-ribosylglycohydrolase family protein [Selenomonadaceae bacterium]
MSDIKSGVLYGAIIGDISGSPYERNPIKTKDYKFIRHSGHFTDDTVMTIAVADALLNCPGFNEDDVKNAVTGAMQFWGRKFPDKGYGHRFKNWLATDNPQPYKSFGNGAAMRVSAIALIGYISNDFDLVRNVARWIAEVTHNHPEAVKSAEAVASAINLAQHGVPKAEIKSYLESEFGYDLSRTVDEIRRTYSFEVAAEKSVPEAIIAFLESKNFEDAIRNAVSLGGDADTQAAIAGSIAEAFYGVPDELKNKVREKLTPELLAVLDEFDRIIRMQKKCTELDGNEDLTDAMRLFNATRDEIFGMDMFKYLCRQIEDNRCVVVPLEKVSDADGYKPLTVYHEQANITFMSVFTNFYEFEKANREKALELKCTTTPIKNLLEICAETNAQLKDSDAPANMGLAINPSSDDVFYLLPELIDELLSSDFDALDDLDEPDDTDETLTIETSADEFSAEKSQAYKNLVAKAKSRYGEYNPKVKPSNADKDRTRDFAAKFDDRKKILGRA